MKLLKKRLEDVSFQRKYLVGILIVLVMGVYGCAQTASVEPQVQVPVDENAKEIVENKPMEDTSKRTEKEVTPPEDEIKQDSMENPVPKNLPTTKEFDLIAKKWVFEPDTITVNQGDTVILHIESVDVKHGISISAFGVREDLNVGEIVDIEFVADKKGTFPLICSVWCGSGHSNMKSSLVVE
jgi:cytochrome c oxidase subunit II